MTRIANIEGRLALVLPDGVIDVERASDGRFGAAPQHVYEQWSAFADWAGSADLSADSPLPEDAAWWSPVPEPRQIVAIGINSRIELEQFGLGEPTGVGFISKLQSSLGHPFAPITITSERVYVETEVAVVVGRRAWHVGEADAWSHVAGLAVAEDLADADAYVSIPGTRDGVADVTYHNPAKSLPGFAPVGPQRVTPDEVADVDDLTLSLSIDGRIVQHGTTRDYLHSIAEIIARLSHQVPLLPGDVILTGSPGQLESSPLEPLRPSSTVVSTIDGLGRQVHVTE
ncbi:fumarylacetoacetate hydrolase family protein [Aeromicrobium sp. UC242_57]|uniref:fumarylacetoacetate hydrolase family protein n=1 Tax=Aeromicrobium sp. UC242_57 TaxID=3374624 RepID=UPI0037AF33C3